MGCILIARMTARVSEAPNAFKGAPHLMDPSRALSAWFTDPPGVFVQFARRTALTLPLAEWLAGPLTASLTKRFPGNEPLIFVLDLTQMDGRDPSARPLIVEAGRALGSRAGRAVLVPPLNTSRVYLASLHAAASLARVVGLTVSVESLSEAVRSLRVASVEG
jgi:hypothetical protein